MRTAVLRAAGFEVDITESKEHTLALLRDHNYDAMVLCWSISEASGAEYATLFRERNPQGCIVHVGKTSLHRPTALQADTFVAGADGPDALLEAVNCRAV